MKAAAGKNAKTSLAMFRGGVFVLSCCVTNHKCSSLKEHTVVWVASLGAPTLPGAGHTTPEAYMSSDFHTLKLLQVAGGVYLLVG